jgi:CRISPR-associated protein Csm2
MTEISQLIVNRIRDFNNFSEYCIRDLVKDAEQLGGDLKRGRLETNQVRKFLDAVKRIKANLIDETTTDKEQFEIIKVDIVLLKPKLAYAAARQKSAEPLQAVLDISIDRVHNLLDFERLVQFVESIIAYHKAAGGK